MTRVAPAAIAAHSLQSLLDTALDRDDSSWLLRTPGPPRAPPSHVLSVGNGHSLTHTLAIASETFLADGAEGSLLPQRAGAAPPVVPAAVSKGLDDALHAITVALRSNALTEASRAGQGRSSHLRAAASAADERAYAALRRSERVRGDTQRIRALVDAERSANCAQEGTASRSESLNLQLLLNTQQQQQHINDAVQELALGRLVRASSPHVTVREGTPAQRGDHSSAAYIQTVASQQLEPMERPAEDSSPPSAPRHLRARAARPPRSHAFAGGALQRRAARAAAWDSD